LRKAESKKCQSRLDNWYFLFEQTFMVAKPAGLGFTERQKVV